MKSKLQIYLASQSPRRRELLQQIGVVFAPLAIELDETPRPGEAPATVAERLALAKAQAGWLSPTRLLDCPVLAADTLVVCDGEILGKPTERAAGLEMLAKLQGRAHEVLTAVAVVQAERQALRLVTSRVHFAALSMAEMQAYVAGGEGRDKAGGYAIQGLAAVFIERLEGSYSAVMGLPLYETAALLKAFSIDLLLGSVRLAPH